MVMRDRGPAVVPAGRPAGLPGHLGRCRGLIQEDERGGIELRLQGGPGGAAGGDVGAVLFAGLRLDTAGEPDTQCHNYQ